MISGHIDPLLREPHPHWDCQCFESPVCAESAAAPNRVRDRQLPKTRDRPSWSRCWRPCGRRLGDRGLGLPLPRMDDGVDGIRRKLRLFEDIKRFEQE